MKYLLIVSSIFLALSIEVVAQKTGKNLLLTGSVLTVDTKCINGKSVPQILLHMQFRNDGDVPLLLLHPMFLFERKVHFVNGSLGDPRSKTMSASSFQFNPYLDNPFGTASEEDYDPFPSFLKLLDSPEPSSVIRIEPGRYHEFQDTVWVNEGFKTELGPGKSDDGCNHIKGIPLPEHPAFRVEYRLSLKNHDRGKDLLETLRDRWKRFGRLVLDGNGNVTFKSEEIIFENPK